MSKLKKRVVKAGSHNYWPKYAKWPRFLAKGFELTVEFPEEGWYDPTREGPLGNDGEDWNKLGGLTSFALFNPAKWKTTFLQNSSAALVGFNPGFDRGTWDVAAYTNMEDRSWHNEDLVTLVAGQRETIKCLIEPKLGLAHYSIRGFNQIEVSLPVDFHSLRWAVGISHGGDEPSPTTHTIKSSLKVLR